MPAYRIKIRVSMTGRVRYLRLIFQIICCPVIFLVCCRKNEDISIPLVRTVMVADVTDVTALFSYDIISYGGSEIIRSGVCWGTDSTLLSLEVSLNNNGSNDTGICFASITNLSPGENYFARAFASNKAGTGYGKAVSFSAMDLLTQGISFNPDADYGYTIDQDGNKYRTVVIGTQVWMAENLKVITNKSGMSLQPGTDYIWYDNDIISNKADYGALYSWDAVSEGNLCPEGWHIPSVDEWNTLCLFVDPASEFVDSRIAGGMLKEAGSNHWSEPNTGATNSTGFTALPSGIYNDHQKSFDYIGSIGFFWSSTWYYHEPTQGNPTFLNIKFVLRPYFNSKFFNWGSNSGIGYTHAAVRCVRDAAKGTTGN